MLTSLRKMEGFNVRGVDGEVGKVKDFYFDTVEWIVRYSIVNTGSWFSGAKVLISPSDFSKPAWQDENFTVSLTKEKIEKSPSIETDRPISKQKEADLIKYYNWPYYWGVTPPIRNIAEGEEDKEERDPHLRSLNELHGYRIKGTDGKIGHVEDFIVEEDSWIIRYMVVDLRNFLPGKKVLIAPEWIDNINWATKELEVWLDVDSIKNVPKYDPSLPIDRRYEEKLYNYFEVPTYWEEEE